jgi:hypothetical protein
VKISGTKFVEIYNRGVALTSANEVSLLTGGSATSTRVRCSLPTSLDSGDFLVLRPDGVGDCGQDVALCVHCPIDLSSGEPPPVLELRDIKGRTLHSLTYPDINQTGAPQSSQSWGAVPDGSDSFLALAPSPGFNNE